ncbi:MAG: elongation factor EF-2 [Candidatus Diapherotrites archaeon]
MGRKEDMANAAQKLMSNQQDVRNIGIVAHIDHGKCVGPDTRLLFADGNVETAQTIFETLSKKGKIVRENQNETVYELPDETTPVFSLNKNTGRIERKPISHVWKLKGGKTFKVTLRNGATVETTPEHPYLIFNGNDFIEKEARALKLGEKILGIDNWLEQSTSQKEEKNTNSKILLMVKNELRVTESEIVDIQESHQDIVYDFTIPENHNFVAEGVFIRNTTMSDNLIAAAGLINKELAGKQQFMDFEDQEQDRGITINAANISLVPLVNGKHYLLNLIDTPGHVDFGGEVIRAMRAVDGVVLVVDAVEGVMPQTETVIRQALRENVKPTLFINKVDRLINELQVDEAEMQRRFVKTITQVNQLIQKNAPEGKEELWQVNPAIGSVAFGSAYHHWAVSTKSMARTGINFKKVYEWMKNDQQKELSNKSPLEDTIFEMIVEHLPNPIEAQKYRTPVIWAGDLESEVGKSMLTCNPHGEVAMMVTDVSVDPHAGDIATGRVYSGTIKKGVKVKLIGLQKEALVNRVGVYMGQDFVEVESIPAGCIGAIVGLREAYAGQTVAQNDIHEFESFKTNVEPVITISIEAKQTKDLPKLIEVIRQLTKEDPNLRASINQTTGEHLLSGMGELHLEINQYRIEKTHGVPITVSQPIVVYHETIQMPSPELEGKSPNKHNKLLMKVEPIPKAILEKLMYNKVQGKVKIKDKEWVDKFVNAGIDNDEAKKIWCIENYNLLVDGTKGIQALHEIRELVIQGFQETMKEGPLGKEEVHGIKVTLTDAKLHEDAIHRGPSQIIPVVSRTIYACMLSAKAVFQEPKQLLSINVPEEYMGAVTKELQQRRVQITEIKNEGDQVIIIGLAPVKELIGFSQAIRGAAQGRVIWTAEYHGYEILPTELQKKTIEEVRKRKGMDPEVKHYSFFLE